MLGALSDILAAIRAIAAMLLKWATPLTFLLPWFAPIGALFAMLGTLAAVADTMTNQINALAASLQGLPSHSYVAMANTMFPVSETIAILGALITLRIGCVGFRMVKSWIPTLN